MAQLLPAFTSNHVVITWPTESLIIETLIGDGTMRRTVLGPPSDKNIF
jgi:hypothetical protein